MGHVFFLLPLGDVLCLCGRTRIHGLSPLTTRSRPCLHKRARDRQHWGATWPEPAPPPPPFLPPRDVLEFCMRGGQNSSTSLGGRGGLVGWLVISDALWVKLGDTIQLRRQDQKKRTKALAILDSGPQRHGDPAPDYSRGKDPRRRAVAVASQEGEVSTEDSDQQLRRSDVLSQEAHQQPSGEAGWWTAK